MEIKSEIGKAKSTSKGSEVRQVVGCRWGGFKIKVGYLEVASCKLQIDMTMRILRMPILDDDADAG